MSKMIMIENLIDIFYWMKDGSEERLEEIVKQVSEDLFGNEYASDLSYFSEFAEMLGNVSNRLIAIGNNQVWSEVKNENKLRRL